MKLMILRHGHAVADAPADNLRQLSARGELEVHKIAQAHYDEIKAASVIVHSPYLRALQTAEIASQYCTGPLQSNSLLVPNGRPDHVIEFLYSLAQEHDSVLMVSHQPLVGTLVDELGGFEPGRYRMSTASLACFECDPLARNCCSLEWLKHS